MKDKSCGCNVENDMIDTDVFNHFPKDIMVVVQKSIGTQPDGTYKEKDKVAIKKLAKDSGKNLREFVESLFPTIKDILPIAEKKMLGGQVAEVFQSGGMVKLFKQLTPINKKRLFRDGGENIIPTGVAHAETNNIPKELKFGKKGIPVVYCDENKCEKTAEIESSELILSKNNSNTLDKLKQQYKKTKSDDVLVAMGKFFKDQVLDNTEVKDNKYKSIIK